MTTSGRSKTADAVSQASDARPTRESASAVVSAAQRRLRLAQATAYRLVGRDTTNQPRQRARSALLARYVPVGGVGAEIGVHQGFLSRHLLDALRPTRLHLIDPWYLDGPEWTWGFGDRSTTNALANIIREYAEELVAGRVVLDIGYDLDVLATVPDATFDWVYLDSSHEFDHTVAELELLHRKVKPGGHITGDDWRSDPEHRHHGVARAVRSFVDQDGPELLYASDDDQQWVVELPSSVSSG